jgi:dihydroorotate dehydrogenase (fumarate)
VAAAQAAPEDVAKYLLVGADIVMTASALLRHGPEHAGVCWTAWPNGWRKGFAMVDDFRGLLAVPAGVDEAAYERAGYLKALQAAGRTYAPT